MMGKKKQIFLLEGFIPKRCKRDPITKVCSLEPYRVVPWNFPQGVCITNMTAIATNNKNIKFNNY